MLVSRRVPSIHKGTLNVCCASYNSMPLFCEDIFYCCFEFSPKPTLA